MSFGTTALGVQQTAQAKDLCVTSAPSDAVSCVSLSPQGNLLVAGSWNNGVSCWELQKGMGGQGVSGTQPKAQTIHEGPVLCTAFSPDGGSVFSGGCDNKVKMWSLANAAAPSQVIGQHDAPVRHMHFIPAMSLLATGSWDKSVRFWDARQPNPTHTLALPERCYAMDVRGPYLVVGTADRKILTYNLGNNCALESMAESTLKYQTRCISIFPDQTGYAVGSIEGRVAIEYFNEQPGPQGQPRPQTATKRGFAFKCHRETNNAKGVTNVYSINAISFHPYGTFSTAGSDGNFNFWDKDSRQRLKTFAKVDQPITCSTFSAAGDIFVYAASYDWSQGSDHAVLASSNNIYIHNVTEDEVKPRDKGKK
jgi:mRNA export factor